MPNQELLKTDIPQMLEISDIVQEGKGQKSFFFRHSIDCKPGQFLMVWLPGIDEKPMAVSYRSKKEFAFTSQAIGRWTNALDKMKKGDKLGIRGPYGNSFSKKDNACVVAGGVGLSSVSTLIDALKNPLIIYGARSKEHLIYLKRYKNKKMIVTTDDGSYGRKGFTTDALEEVLKSQKLQDSFNDLSQGNSAIFDDAQKHKMFLTNKKNRIKIVYTCGPEVMMKKVFDLCQKYKVECEASLERMMKCGFGVCGACMINDKIVCMDGPVFNSSQLSKLSEFGKFARIKTGRKVTLKEYHSTH